MSLKSLFTDRKVRNLIKESVYNASESINSTCSCCHRSCNTLNVGNYTLCEECAKILSEVSENYDRAYDDSYLNIDTVIEREIIAEAICKIGDFQKLKDDTEQKYGGDLANLFKAYGIQKPYNCGSIISKGYTDVEILPTDLTGGASKVNRFIDDYDIILSTRAKNSLVADPDGYLSKSVGTTTGVNTSAAGSPKTPSTVSNTSSATTQTKTVKGPGFSASGDDSSFEIKLADDIILVCTQVQDNNGSKVYDVVLKDTKEQPMQYTVKSGDIKDMAKEIVAQVKNAPCNVFTSFDDEFESTKGYILNEYPNYSFMFDDDSFDGKNLTLVLALNGKPYANTRIILTKKDILSKASLDGKLLSALNNRLAKFYPVLFDGSMNINTSIGKAVSSLLQVDNNNTVTIHTELGNKDFNWEINGNNLKDKDVAINAMFDAVYKDFDKIIPDWNKNTIRDKKSVKNYTDSFTVECAQGTVLVNLNFSLNDLYDKHDVVFHMSVIDKQSGIEQPKEFEPFVYNRPGTKIEDFADLNGEKIYKKFFNKSDLAETISASAQEKLKNKSKREVFLVHVADTLKRSLGKDILKNLDLDIVDFDVNKDQKVTNVTFRVSDPFNDVADTSDNLKNLVGLDKESWIRVDSVDNSPRSLKLNGPSVIYKVTKLKDFSDCINLPVLESAMLEAFGIIREGRKVIGVNEAYWKVVDGENVLVF